MTALEEGVVLVTEVKELGMIVMSLVVIVTPLEESIR